MDNHYKIVDLIFNLSKNEASRNKLNKNDHWYYPNSTLLYIYYTITTHDQRSLEAIYNLECQTLL